MLTVVHVNNPEGFDLSVYDRMIAKAELGDPHPVDARLGRCLLCGCSTDRNGYGSISVLGKMRKIHRVAYELFVGPIPAGFEIDHTCRQTSCFNHRHLEAVTRAENNRRKALAQTRCLRGHDLDDAYVYNGRRNCRRCALRRAAESKARKRASR